MSKCLIMISQMIDYPLLVLRVHYLELMTKMTYYPPGLRDIALNGYSSNSISRTGRRCDVFGSYSLTYTNTGRGRALYTHCYSRQALTGCKGQALHSEHTVIITYCKKKPLPLPCTRFSTDKTSISNYNL